MGNRAVVFLFVIFVIVFISIFSVSAVITGHDRIGIRQINGGWEFYDKASGETFVMRGNSYMNSSNDFHSVSFLYPLLGTVSSWLETTLEPGFYNDTQTNISLYNMSKMGYTI